MRWKRSPEPSKEFRALFDEFHGPVYRLFRRWRFSPEDARDLAQETFLRAHMGFDRFRGDSSPATWIFAIAGNIIRNEKRRRGTLKRAAVEVSTEELPHQGDAIEAPGPDRDGGDDAEPLSQLLEDEKMDVLRERIRFLPPQMQRCVRLTLDQGLKLGEIATVLGLSPETVKAHLFQAKKRLKTQVLERFDGTAQEEHAPHEQRKR